MAVCHRHTFKLPVLHGPSTAHLSTHPRRLLPYLAPVGLEFIRFALRRLWLGEQGAAYLRGYSVAHTFEQHVSGFSDSTKK